MRIPLVLLITLCLLPFIDIAAQFPVGENYTREELRIKGNVLRLIEHSYEDENGKPAAKPNAMRMVVLTSGGLPNEVVEKSTRGTGSLDVDVLQFYYNTDLRVSNLEWDDIFSNTLETFTYRTEGNKLYKTKKGDEKKVEVFTYDNNKRLSEYAEYTSDLQKLLKKEQYTWNNYGIAEIVSTSSDVKQPGSRMTYKYNERGELIEERSSDIKTGKTKLQVLYHYSAFDKAGNYTDATITQKEPGEPDEKFHIKRSLWYKPGYETTSQKMQRLGNEVSQLLKDVIMFVTPTCELFDTKQVMNIYQSFRYDASTGKAIFESYRQPTECEDDTHKTFVHEVIEFNFKDVGTINNYTKAGDCDNWLEVTVPDHEIKAQRRYRTYQIGPNGRCNWSDWKTGFTGSRFLLLKDGIFRLDFDSEYEKDEILDLLVRIRELGKL